MNVLSPKILERVTKSDFDQEIPQSHTAEQLWHLEEETQNKGFKTFAGDITLTNLPCLTSVLPGNTSDSRNASLTIYQIINKTRITFLSR